MRLLDEGIDRIWSEWGNDMGIILKDFCTNTRKVDYQTMRDYGCFFCLDDKFMVDAFGREIMSPVYKVYKANMQTILNQRMVIPLRDFKDSVIGFTGYDTPPALPKYVDIYPGGLDKSRFLFLSGTELRKAYKDDYIIVVDGMFDKINLTGLGFNACNPQGSEFNMFHRKYLKGIKNVYVIRDNDDAGIRLGKKIETALGARVIAPPSKYKDIDAFIQSDKEQARDYIRKELNIL